MAGLYVHIPFCTTRCPYCAFTSVPSPPEELMERYAAALQSEIGQRAGKRREPFRTLYIGGGTPTALPSNLLEDILVSIDYHDIISDVAEATIEANPESIDQERMAVAAAGGINRISIGIQSFNDTTLRSLGRPHNGRESIAAIDLARREGVENISVDLIYGVSGQTLNDWEEDLRRVVGIAPDHISLYGLTLEKGTPFDSMARRGELPLPTDEETVRMYRLAGDLLAAGGWERYEISNWARPGRQCRHNLDCWRLEEYDGVGVAAHGFSLRPSPCRYGNVEGVEDYIRLVGQGEAPRAFEEKIDERTLAAEGLMLGLRTTAGVDQTAYRGSFGAPPAELFPEALETGRASGWLAEEAGRLRFTAEGLLFSNEVFQLLF